MGFFSKHKKDEEKPLPPPPKTGSDASAPPSGDLNLDKAPEVKSEMNLSPPPAPGGTLADIKEEVSKAPTNEENKSSRNVSDSDMESPATEESKDSFDFGDDSLFDMSDLDLDSDNTNSTPTNGSSPKVPEVEENNEMNFDSDDDSEEETMPLDSSTSEREGSFRFISNKNISKTPMNSTYYVTTQQFRTLLEVVDSVKNRVKDSTDTHLRLMDLKSEEDIELENLRKDFQFIEDKLYELDSLIFEK